MRFLPRGTPAKLDPPGGPSRHVLQSPREEARLDAIFERLRRASGGAMRAAEEREVEAAERVLGLPFPTGYRRFLLEVGGSTRENPWRGLWRIDEVAALNRTLPVFRWFGGLLGIGNEGFLVYALDYRTSGEDPPLVSLGLSSSSEEDVSFVADRFEDWLASTLSPE